MSSSAIWDLFVVNEYANFAFLLVAQQHLHRHQLQISLMFICGFMIPSHDGFMPPYALLITNNCEPELGNKTR